MDLVTLIRDFNAFYEIYAFMRYRRHDSKEVQQLFSNTIIQRLNTWSCSYGSLFIPLFLSLSSIYSVLHIVSGFKYTQLRRLSIYLFILTVLFRPAETWFSLEPITNSYYIIGAGKLASSAIQNIHMYE